MKVLVLTNENHAGFVSEYLVDFSNKDFNHTLMMKYRGEYDWSEDYDIGISFMYQYKVPKSEIDSHIWINFHPAPLPEYKGRNLCYHAIMNGEKEFGATVHYMDENFDTGDIIEVRKFDIMPSDTAQNVSEWAVSLSKELFIDYFPKIIQGYNFGRYPNVGGTYYKQEPIEDFIGLNDYQDKRVRAITYRNFYPKIDIGGVIYKIVKDE